jgi:hypothetical protein
VTVFNVTEVDVTVIVVVEVLWEVISAGLVVVTTAVDVVEMVAVERTVWVLVLVALVTLVIVVVSVVVWLVT